MSPEPTVSELVEAFLQSLESARRSPHTLANYGYDLRAFARQFDLPISQVTTQMLEEHLRQYCHLAPATQARHQAALRSFLKWCVRRDYLSRNPADKLEAISLPQRVPRPLKAAQVRRILQVIPRANLRDRLLFTLLYETGMRIGEALGIWVEEVDLSPDDEKVMVRGKGGKTRTVMLYDAPETLKLLSRYLRQTGYRSGPLFRGPGSKKPLTYRAAAYAWEKYCRKAGVKASIHQLRHTHVTELLNEGVRIEVVRKKVGHARLQTTLGYGEVAEETVKRELLERLRRRPSR